MKERIFLAMLISLFGLSLSAQTVTGVNIVNYQAKQIDSNPKMFVIPVVASIEIIKEAPTSFSTHGAIKIPANGTAGRPSMNDSEYMAYVDKVVKNRIEELKSQALFEYSEKCDADLILSPMYSITTDESKDMLVSVTIKVKGYPARYTKFREMTENDNNLVTTAALIDENVAKQFLNSQSLTNNETIIRK